MPIHAVARRPFIAALLVALIAGAAHAQDDADAPPPPDLLRGPTVEAEDPRDQPLATQDFMGGLEELEGLPELVALDRLDLTPAQRAAVDAVDTERAAAIDAIVAADPNLFVEAANLLRDRPDPGPRDAAARAAARERVALIRKVRAAIAPIEARGTLREELAAALPPSQRDRFHALLDEYDAMRLDAMRDGTVGEPRARAMLQRERIRREFGESFQRVVVMPAQDFQARLESMNLSPEVTETFRRVAQRRRGETQNDADPRGTRRAFLRDVFRELTPEQSAELRRELARLRAEERAGR